MLCDICWITFHIKFIYINAAHVIAMLKTQGQGWIQDNQWEYPRYGSTMMEFLAYLLNVIKSRRMLSFPLFIRIETHSFLMMKLLPEQISYT